MINAVSSGERKGRSTHSTPMMSRATMVVRASCNPEACIAGSSGLLLQAGQLFQGETDGVGGADPSGQRLDSALRLAGIVAECDQCIDRVLNGIGNHGLARSGAACRADD